MIKLEKKKSCIIWILMTVICTFFVCMIGNVSVEAKTVTKDITIGKGKTYAIEQTFSGKATFKTSNKKIAVIKNGKIIGKSFPKSMKETTLMGYYAMGGAGDKKLVYRTDIIKKYPPYPVFEGEKYVALAYKYRLIDQDYKLAVLPQILCNVEYQEDGSSGTMWKQYLKNPKGFAFWRKICMRYPESRKRKIVDCIHYCSSSQIAKDKWYIRESPAKFMTFLCSPLGVVLTMMVKHKARK